jgi:hypothetical protein
LFTDVLGAFVSPMHAAGIGLAPETWTSGPSVKGAAAASAESVSAARKMPASAARSLRRKDLTSP